MGLTWEFMQTRVTDRAREAERESLGAQASAGRAATVRLRLPGGVRLRRRPAPVGCLA